MTKESYIFLDFDGVLTTARHAARLRAEDEPIADEWGTRFDPQCVGQLDWLVRRTGARIVVTSSWRYLHTTTALAQLWEARAMPGRILSVTPTDIVPDISRHHYNEFMRGMEISYWLERKGMLRREGFACRFAIIDDEPVRSASLVVADRFERHTVHTDPKVGLDRETARRAAEIILDNRKFQIIDNRCRAGGFR